MPRKFSEASTRKEMIDPQLEHAGWYLRDHSRVKIEIPVDGYDKEPWNGVSDYCLYRENGEVLVWKIRTQITQNNYNADQILFLGAVQSVFLQKRHLETVDLYDAPALIGFGQDAVERWFTEKEVEDVVQFANRMAV